jgi:antirestriction protein ArdC
MQRYRRALLQSWNAAPWMKPWSATAGLNTQCKTNRPYSGCNVVLLWMAQAAGYRTPRYLTFKQALELGGHVRKGEHGTKVYFVKQLQVRDGDDDTADMRIVPMLREYTARCVPPPSDTRSRCCDHRSNRARAAAPQKAATHWFAAEAVIAPKNPMVGSLPGCCARATSGHAAAAPPSVAMKARRFIRSPRRRGR